MKLARPFAFALVTLLAVVAVATPALADHQLLNLDKDGVILDGYDPVAFFTDHKPVKGDANIAFTYHGAIYHFASEEHRAAFEADPAKYEPQFGAFCAYAVSQGRTAEISVDTFSIVDGRLVLQHNEKAVRLWEEDVHGNLAKADKYWPAVVANDGKQIDVSTVK